MIVCNRRCNRIYPCLDYCDWRVLLSPKFLGRCLVFNLGKLDHRITVWYLDRDISWCWWRMKQDRGLMLSVELSAEVHQVAKRGQGGVTS